MTTGVKRLAVTGNEAVAMAMRQINPDVVAAYPITPQTDIVQYFSEFVANGQVDTEFVTVESEHSAMSAVIAAAASGARSMTATSANGLALMWEMLYIAAGYRLPIVMPLVNRALSGPINIHCDHSDAMGARSSGWIQLFSENAQEAYDNTFQAIRIAEHPDVCLPVMVCQDGFIISHSLENMYGLGDEEVRDFIGPYHPPYNLLDPGRPITVGPLDLYDYYFEHKLQQSDAMRRALDVIPEVGREFAALTGRDYGYFGSHRLDDADIAMVALGSAAGTASAVADELRGKGIKAGLLNLRVFRPFPAQALARALAGCAAVAVLDRADGFAATGGPVYDEVRAALYGRDKQPPVVNYIYGLGGRDVGPDQLHKVYSDLLSVAEQGRADQNVSYLGVRK